MAWGCMVVLGEEGVETSVDYGAALIDALYTTMEEIASGTRRVEYLELWFADERGNAGSLEEALAGHGSALQNHRTQRDLLRESRPRIEELWKMVCTM